MKPTRTCRLIVMTFWIGLVDSRRRGWMGQNASVLAENAVYVNLYADRVCMRFSGICGDGVGVGRRYQPAEPWKRATFAEICAQWHNVAPIALVHFNMNLLY